MRNFIFISPNFPTRYFKFAESLKKVGFRVLGIGDCPHYQLHERLKNALDDYYVVNNMEDINQLIMGVNYFQNKYGKVDFLESNNEHWLVSDSKLREHFDISSGIKFTDVLKFVSKLEMKKYFKKAGVCIARYCPLTTYEKACEFAELVSYPIFIKPQIGVGAKQTKKINNSYELQVFFENITTNDYIIEEYLEGEIVSFDGVSNDNGDVVFYSVDHFPTPLDVVLKEQLDFIYYNNPFSKGSLESYGRKIIKEFGVKNRFFHIEFFRLSVDKIGLARKGDFVALECNMRPPGGSTPDLIDYGESLSVYDIYAEVMMTNQTTVDFNKEKFIAIAVCMRDRFNYKNDEKQIYDRYHDNIEVTSRNPAILSDILGNKYYYAKFKELNKALEFSEFVLEKSK